MFVAGRSGWAGNCPPLKSIHVPLPLDFGHELKLFLFAFGLGKYKFGFEAKEVRKKNKKCLN